MHKHRTLLALISAGFFGGALGSQAMAAPKARVKRAAPVYNLQSHKARGKLTTRATIRAAALECLQDHLGRPKWGGPRTIAEVNGVDPKSVRLSSVKIFPRRVAFDAVTELNPNQVRFEARYWVRMEPDAKPAKLYLRSEMEIGKKAPIWGPRTRSPAYGDGVRSLPFHRSDPTTLSWVD